jgi:serine/threonine-protein kinase
VPHTATAARGPAPTADRAETQAEARAKAPPPRERKPRPDSPAVAVAAAPAAAGKVTLAISPWGQVEVDGAPMGTAPPLTNLSLSAGRHTITVRNADFPPLVRQVEVDAERPVQLKHRFGP